MTTDILRDTPSDDAEHVVDIITRDTGKTLKALGPYSGYRQAEKAERGVTQQLDHERFYTQIRPVGN